MSVLCFKNCTFTSAAKSVEAVTPVTPKKHAAGDSQPTTPKSILRKTRGRLYIRNKDMLYDIDQSILIIMQ